eukprot:1160671-Pelagomonas_calceolata.AAC.7
MFSPLLPGYCASSHASCAALRPLAAAAAAAMSSVCPHLHLHLPPNTATAAPLSAAAPAQ